MNNDFPSSIYISPEQELRLEDARVQAWRERTTPPETQTDDEECPHEFHMGQCIGCGDAAEPDVEYAKPREPRIPRDVLSIEDIDMIGELVAVAVEAMERKARDDLFEAQNYRIRAQRYREFEARMARR